MRNRVAIAVAPWALFALSACGDGSAPPAPGTYRIRTLSDRGNASLGIRGALAAVRVEYRGPREWVEIVLETQEGGRPVASDILLREPFGAFELDTTGSSTTLRSSRTFTQRSLDLSITIRGIEETLLDGRNALAVVRSAPPGADGFSRVLSKLIRVATMGGSSASSEWFHAASLERSSDPPPDSEATLLWESRTDPGAGTTPIVSKLLLRFVPE
jgi:hypothetical protein